MESARIDPIGQDEGTYAHQVGRQYVTWAELTYEVVNLPRDAAMKNRSVHLGMNVTTRYPKNADPPAETSELNG